MFLRVKIFLLMMALVFAGCKVVDHQSSSHNPEDGHWCNVCKRSFATWGKFSKHETAFHGEPWPYDLGEKWRLLFDKTSRP